MMKETTPGVWRGDLWHQGKRVKLTHRGSAKEAKAYEARKRLEVEKGGIVNARAVLSFEDFATNKYEPAAKLELRASTWSVRRYQMKSLKKHFGPLKLTKIDEQRIEQYKQARAASVGKVAINTELNVLSAVLSYAEALKIPCAHPKIKRFRVTSKKGATKFYTREQVGFILAACAEKTPAFLPFVTFLLETGARKSEALNLRWSNVLFDQQIVRIWSHADDDDADEEQEEDGDNTYEVKSVEREVPLSDHLLVVLKEQKLRGLSADWVFPVRRNNTGHTKGERYAHFPKHTWTMVLARANEKAKEIDPKARAIAGGPHRCRHTFASHFLAAKPDLFLLGRVLGHSHGRVTELYAHLVQDHMAEARNLVSFTAAKQNHPKDHPQGAKKANSGRAKS